MTTFLRSLQFVRRFSLHGRRLGCSSTTHVINTQLLNLSRRQCALLHEQRTYVTKPQFNDKIYNELNIDNLLNELDQRVRNYRGIYKSHIDQVLNAVTEKGSLTHMQALLLIRCCGEFLRGESPAIRNALTEQIWEIIKELRVPLDVSHYNALLLVYLENEKDFSPVDILCEMKANKIEPNHVTFQRLIRQYCNKGDISGATKILEHMSEKEIPINENIFNSLIKGHSESGDISNSIKILDIMKNAGIELTSRTYSEILCAHAKAGDVESIKSTFNQCQEKNIQLTDKEVLDVIYTLAVNQHLNMIDEMISYLNKGGLYNKDAVACILKLLEKNCIDVAYILLKTLLKPENLKNYESGGFFLRKLVTSDASNETMIKYCNLLLKDELHHNPFELTIIYMFTHNKQQRTLSIMKSWAETGAEIREHYFFPIFVAHSKDNNLQGLLNTVKSMVFDFKITPSISTIKEYIVPYLVEDVFTNAQTLVNNHLPFANVAHAILLHLLSQSKTQLAHDFITSTTLTYRLGMLTRPLTRALARTKDSASIAGIVHQQYVLAQKNQNTVSEDKLTSREFSSLIVSKAVIDLPSYDTTLMIEFLQNLYERGVGIDKGAAEQVKQYLGNTLNDEIEGLLNALTSDSLEPKNIERNGNHRIQRYRNSKDSIEESDEFHKLLQVQQYVRNGEKEAVQQSLSQLEQENIKYFPGFCATLIDYYASLDDVEGATKWFTKLKEIGSGFKLNKGKILKYAATLIQSNKIEEALEVLKNPINDVDNNRNVLAEKLLERVYNVCPERTEEFVKLMHDQKLINIVTANMFAPLIKGYLKAGDIEKVIEKYKWVCENYKLTPCKILIMSHLINKEDAKTLKYITDLSTKVHGEVNSLIDLAVAFFECNRLYQARKILETPGLRLNREKMRIIIEKYYMYDETRLEGFIQLLNGLFLDVDPFYVLLLKSYGKKGKWEKCLALWTQMQEENIQPSVTFMEELERILKQCNQEIPFATSHKESVTDQNFACLA
ncbi:leucine-rich PPR motif-containing protein, mitochondrial-like [Phymastichus coffea]|uniref:leucine-rich PPR motif-containing protein, mitochondrial-like n=1 Tax=Phymastichus coffea TaxID=108790 RepID=UPI00273A96E3|nr:leucine-rich PPR motif-containing protein, mitochondrial-like [Phymastichus coffea]XP_058793241.1 leucine-rich PPR motif-containing protein, mitochondrial-like [Phymastichus coffea]